MINYIKKPQQYELFENSLRMNARDYGPRGHNPAIADWLQGSRVLASPKPSGTMPPVSRDHAP
jgi:hypothetical protein